MQRFDPMDDEMIQFPEGEWVRYSDAVANVAAKQVFAVFREGVYRQECAGIFSTLELAKAAAVSCISGEPDDYHSYKIVPFAIDAASIHDDEADNGELKEPEDVCSIRRAGGRLITVGAWGDKG